MDPKMTHHAKVRCAEMGISTKVAKRMVKNPSVTHTTQKGGGNRVICTSTEYPLYAVVYSNPDDDGIVWIITVLFNTQVRYDRNGITWKECE